jgi:type I restriction enzyme S subunit
MSTATLQIEKKKTLVPQLRFQECDGEWKEIRLGDYISIKSGNSPSSYNFIDEGTYPFIKVEELNNCNKYQNTSRFYSNEKKNLIEKFSVIFPKRGAAILNNKVRINDCPILMDSNMMAITPLRNKLNHEFLYYKIVKEELFKIADTSTIPQINNKHIEPYRLFIAPLPEQQKIASFLCAVDEKIQQLTRKAALLEQYKKGVMQQLFSGKLRFKDENGKDYPDWEEKKLGEVCTFFSGGTPTSTNQKYYSGTIPFIGSGNIYDSEVFSFITEEALNNSSAKIIKKGDLLYALYGANSGEVSISKMEGAINQAVLCIRSKESIEYLYYVLLSNKDRIVAKFIQGGQGNLSSQIIKRLKYNFPCLEEQQKIANFLSGIDSKKESVNQQLAQTQTFKKGLLQQLFV